MSTPRLPTQDDHRSEIIEVLRFFAAMCVVFVHVPTIERGNFGVDVFFVISGFVMMLSTETSTDNFFLKRCIRIIPTYYAFTLLVFGIALLFPSLLQSTKANFAYLAQSLLFIPYDRDGTGHFPILFLGWTLNYEMFFYLLFALALKIQTRHRGLISVLLLAMVFHFSRPLQAYPWRVYGDPIIFEFALGIAIYLALHKRAWIEAAAVCATIALILLINDMPWRTRFALYGLPAAALVVLSLQLFRAIRFPRILLTLGGASYALYLTHPYVIQLLDRLLGWFSKGSLLAALATTVALILVNVAAVLIYRLFELPVRNLLRRKLIA